MAADLAALACRIDLHEGTLLYHDAERQQARIAALVQIVTVAGDLETQTAVKTHGEIGMLVQSLASFFVHTPGLLEAVTGMVTMMRQRGGG